MDKNIVEKKPVIDVDVDAMIQQFIESQMTDEEKYDDEDSCNEAVIEEEVDVDPCAYRRKLDALTGLKAVKDKLSLYERMVRFNVLRAEHRLSTSMQPLHAMFLGSPGTGKTTVAKLIGEMLHHVGVLSSGHVVVRERATLLGIYYSSESEKTLQAIEEAQGGILLIDEAYQLFQPDDPRDPGKFVIETLLTALSDESRRDWMLILAGYPDEMRRMFDMNPGFKSRIPDSNIYVFDDFNAGELMSIARNYLREHQYTLTAAADAALESRLAADYVAKKKNFGNARHVVNLIETEILPAMALRVTAQEDVTESTLTEILADDIPERTVQPVRKRFDSIGFN